MRLQPALYFIAGAAVGVSTAALVLKDKYKKDYEAKAESEIASMREYVEKLRQEDKKGDLDSQLEFVVSQDGEWSVEEYKELIFDTLTTKLEEMIWSGPRKKKEPKPENLVKKDDKKAKQKVTYNSFYKENDEKLGLYSEKEAEIRAKFEHPEEEYAEEVKEKVEKMTDEGPKIIGADEFDEFEWHDKVTLLYYTEDDTLVVEETNELIDDPEQLVGDLIHTSGFDENDDEVMYVRNIRRGTDYEIAKMYGPYLD